MAARDSLLNDNEQGFRIAFDGRQAMMWTACPGIVKAIDFTKMVLQVQPAIQGVIENENGVKTFVNMPLLINVPIVFPSGGGFIITFPIAIDDEVLVVFGSRCIDAWWQSSGIQKPMEARMHDLSDGFAIPGPRSVPKVAPTISASELQIRNNAGTAYVAITPDGKIKLVAPDDVEVTGNLKVTGNLEFDGNLEVDGDLTVTGAVGAEGEVTAKSLTTPIALSTHVHSGVTTGGGSSGPPVP